MLNDSCEGRFSALTRTPGQSENSLNGSLKQCLYSNVIQGMALDNVNANES